MEFPVIPRVCKSVAQPKLHHAGIVGARGARLPRWRDTSRSLIVVVEQRLFFMHSPIPPLQSPKQPIQPHVGQT
jgi:hypothetical protein